MPSIDLGSHELWYEDTGDGPAVLFVHGLFFDHRMWEAQIEAFQGSHRCIAVDVRCHGSSGCPDTGWDLWDAAEDISALLDHLDLEQVHWVGLSMGGMIGLRFALDHQDRLASLVLLDTSAEREAREKMHKAMAGLARFGGRPLIRLMMPYVAGQMFSKSFKESPEAKPWLDQVEDLEPRRVHAGAMAVFDRGSLVDRLAEIRVPTMVLVGDRDQATPPQNAETLEKGIPDARRALVPGAGHLSAVERPEYVNRLVGGFLDQVDQGAEPVAEATGGQADETTGSQDV